MQIQIDKRSSYNETHTIQLLRSLQKKPKSRASLSKEMCLGETTIRTMFRNLRSAHLTEPTTKGETLSKKGRSIVEIINCHISPSFDLDIKRFTLHDNNIGHRIRGQKKQITNATYMRDNAIKLGASGLILLSHEETLRIIGIDENSIDIPEEISNIIKPEKGDMIIITFADSKNASEVAGLGIALDLIGFSLHAKER